MHTHTHLCTHHTLCGHNEVTVLYLAGVFCSSQSGHFRKQIIDTWVLGSDVSAELSNASVILSVLHCDGFVCVGLPGLWVPLYTSYMYRIYACEWVHVIFYRKLLWMQLMAELYATRCNTLTDNCLRCTIAHRNLSFIPNYCFPEVERDRGREGKGEEEIYALWRQRSTHTNGS